MKVAVGFDHAGFPLKQITLEAVRSAGHEPIDMGTNSAEPVDFPDFTEKVGRAIQSGKAEPSANWTSLGSSILVSMTKAGLSIGAMPTKVWIVLSWL